jgi:hypothetical protein
VSARGTRLEQGESVWAKTITERDGMIEALEHWQGGPAPDDEGWTD